MPAAITVDIGRTDAWTTSFDVYAKLTYWPTEAGDGIFAGNVAIAPPDNMATLTWTPPTTSAVWKYAAVSKYQNIVGPLGKLA